MRSDMIPERKFYFHSIDGLRLFAAMNVVLFHYQDVGGFYNMGGTPVWFFNVIKAPAFHASLFFILSGFIFTMKYLPHYKTFEHKKFLLSRFRDLYPLHVGTTCAMALLKLIASDSVNLQKMAYSVFIHLSFLYAFIPFNTYGLNRPSWALSAFVLCYVMLPVLLRLVYKVRKRRYTVLLMVLCLVPGVVWWIVYSNFVNDPSFYQFYHSFGFIRIFEFIIGMLMARHFMISYCVRSKKSEGVKRGKLEAVFFDSLILLSFAMIYVSIVFRDETRPLYNKLSYHVFLIVPFVLLLASLARERGIIPKFFALPAVRLMGQSSFYPYLLHIPLMSWFCWILSSFFGYKKFLHSPLNVFGFVIMLYAISCLYWNIVRKRKRKRYKPEKKAE